MAQLNFHDIEKQNTRFGDRQRLLQIGDHAEHTLSHKVGVVVGVVEVDGDRKLTVELPNGKMLALLSHREFRLSNLPAYVAAHQRSVPPPKLAGVIPSEPIEGYSQESLAGELE